MEHYQATTKVDVTQTLVWRYLCVVFGWSEEYTSRVSELLDRVAWKLQNPAQRSRKINVLFAVAQGVGKSAFYRFLMMLFSRELCCFHSSLDKYDCQFDIQLNSKLIHFVDDLQGASKSSTRKLSESYGRNSHLRGQRGKVHRV